MLTRPAQHEVSEPQDFTSRYTVTKTSWKGRFTRIFAIGKTSIATLNPQTLFKETNRFMYGRTLRDVQPDGSSDCHFTVSVLNQHGKSESMNFCCRTPEERFALLSDLQANRHLFDEAWARSNTSSSNMFQAKKLSWDNSSRHCFLRVTPCGVDQIVGDQVVGRYLFMHLNTIADVSSDAHKIILQYGPDGRLHLFDVNSRVEFIEYVRRCAQRYIGLIAGQHFLRASDPLSVTEFSERRYGIRLDQLAPLMEFAVSKISRKHTNESAVARIVSTTESGFLVERDPSTYAITSVYPLRQVEAIVRSDEDEQRMHLVIRSPHKVRCYTLPLRDVFMAHLVEGCREAGNLSACIVSRAIDHGKRVGPCEVPVTEEVEGLLLRCLVDPSVSGKPPPVTAEVVEEFFNANVDHLGLRYAENRGRMFSENREKLVFQALSAVLNRRPTAEDVFSVEQHLRVLRRLVLSRVAYSSIALLPDLARSAALFAVEAMNHQHTATTFAALEFLNAIMAPHHDQYELKHEYINKNRILHAEAFVRSLLVMLRDIMREEASSLVVQSILQLLVYAICPPYSSTTDEEVFSRVLHDLMEIVGKQLFHLLSHACDSIRYLAGQLLRVLLEEGTEDQFKQLQRSALRDGSFLLEFNAAMYSTNRLHRDLARRLIAYWAYKNTKLQDILRRMVPVTLLSFLQEKESAPVEEQLMEMEKPVKAMDDGFLECKKGWFKPYFHPSQLLPPSEQPVAPPSSPEASTPASADGKEPTPPATPAVKLRERRLRVQPTLNWEMFFTQIKQDHMRPDLIWTATTREELRQSIDQELQRFASGAEFSVSDSELPVAWNCEEFEVSYPSLKDELQVGQHYPRLLFECKNPVIARPQEFFNDLYHRFLLVSDTRTRLECLHGMAVLYQHYGEKIGQFNDLSYLLAMLKDTTDPMFRDRMLLFLRYALTVRSNAKQLLDCRGVETLAESVTLAQLHIDRPTLPMQSSAIEYAGNLEDIQAKENEWHYYKDGQRASPVSYTELKSMYQKGAITDRSKVWAQGMSGWRELREVPQLRWGICAAGHPAILSLTEVTCTILDIFMVLCQHYPTRDEDGAVMQPIPRVKLLLGSPSVIPHIVQLLLTFDPCVCTRVHRLLLHVMTDNQRLNRLYLSGYFFFSLMYAASDVLPMCEVFYMAHHRQAFRLSESPQEAVRTSVLAPLLPPAMICYLSNHGPEKFAELLLSDMETPEAIWNKEMRRLLASKLACHVADFTPRLLANNTIMYQYCPIVPVTYEVLQQELFCSGYYLRHLCDTVKYPEWPIRDPSHFLRDVMAVWRERQAGRKDAPMTRERALEDLGFEAAEAAHEVPLPTIRKAYYQRAAQFHPDKNPNGRETFERVQAAYEFLAAQHSSKVEVSDAHDMRLILKSQCILFQRCGHELQRYKYPGYALLFSALAKEMQDVNIVENGLELTTLLVELSYQSVSNVPLNADELQEEGVIALLSTLLQRCFHHVTMTSTDADQTSRAAYFCMKTLAVCGGLDECRTRMAYEPEVTYLTAKGIACKQAPDLCSACVEACTAEAESQLLQYRLISAGAVWHLLQLLFRYDPTVEDSGISMDASLHRQCQDNRMAVLAVGALCALAGFHPEGSGRSTHRQAEVVEQLRVLLSPYIGHLMECKPACEREVLRLLNGNSESPCFLWNNSTRAELLDIVGRNARAAWASPDPQTRLSSSDELEAFQYALHDGELMVGGIYLRLYVSQPQFVVEKPDAFYHALITFVEAQLTLFDPNPVKVEGHLQLALQAMENIVTAAPDSMERQTTPADSLLVLLRAIALNHAPAITIQAAKHLEHLSGISSSLASLGEVEHAMKFVARALNQYRSSDHHSIAVQEALLHFLQVALMNRSIVQQTMDSGLYVVLLYLMATTEVPSICIACCTCIAKASADRLVGPRIVRYTINLLPSVLLDTLLEHPQQAYQLLRNTQMNPELCWNEGKRNQLLADLATCRTSQERWAAGTSSEAWEMPELSHDEALDEYQVANVYVEMFVKHPGWSVRRPKQFLAALCDAFLQLAEKEQDGPTPATEHRLQLVTAAHVHLLRTTPGLRDYMVSLGYVTKVVGMLGSSNPVVAKATLEWVHEMAESPACIKAMAVADPVGRLLHLWSREPSLTVDALTALERLFTHSSRTNLLQYALHHQIPQVLLNLLDTGVAENHTTVPPAAFRALLIKVIKAMLVIEDPVYGPVVSGILSQSATWKKYQHHSHDLFLRDAAAAPRTVDTLYLTAAMADGVSDGTRDPRIPPPL